VPPNYTQCLQWEHIEVLAPIVDRLIPDLGDTFFNEAFNKRLGTKDLGAADIWYQANLKKIDPRTIPTMVEQDSWDYNTTRYGEVAQGKAMVCCVFVCNIWKAGGLFESLGNEVNCGEHTNWDDYVLTLFDTTTPRPKACVDADPDNKLCQLEGKYALKLNDFATKKPYKHQAEKCPSLPPKYEKPKDC